MNYSLLKTLTKKRIKRVVPEEKWQMFFVNSEGVNEFIKENYIDIFPELSLKFPIEIPKSEDVVIVSTLDTECNDVLEDTMSDKVYNYLFDNDSEESFNWGGLHVTWGKNRKWLHLYDDTCGLHYSTFISL